MSKPKPPTNQELFLRITNLMLGIRDTATDFEFPNITFKRRFHVLEVERGIYRHLEELPGCVMAYTTIEAVASAILTFVTDELDDISYAFYKFTAAKAKQCAEFWCMRQLAVFTDKIHPVLELSQEGYCHRRLDFDAAPGDCPLWHSFLSRVETNAEALKAFIGAILDSGFARQHYLWIYGPGGDGKGTLFRLIRALMGDAYVALSSDFKQQNQFFSASLIGKRVGAFQDCHNPKLVQSEIFMQLTGGDPMRVEPKNMAAYTADLDAMIMVSSNFEPAITGSEAHQRRGIVCRMSKREGDDVQKEAYFDALWAERAAILWECKEAWAKMKAEHGGMHADQTINREIADSTETRWERLTDKYFVVNTEIGGTLKRSDFYAILTETERLTNYDVGHFKRYLQRLGVDERRASTDGRPWLMVGLHLKTSINHAPMTVGMNGETRF